MKRIIWAVMCVVLVELAQAAPTVETDGKGNLLTFGFPKNQKVNFGKISYGAEPPQCAGDVTGMNFHITGMIPDDEGFVVYGRALAYQKRRSFPKAQVWRARTKDGFVFENARMLFEIPKYDPPVHWNGGDVAPLGKDQLILFICHLGKPPTKGHPYHAFAGGLDGKGWRRLNPQLVYRGQDAISMGWNSKLGKFVNYQISYQPFIKQFRDNIPKIRRVLHIRTSPDGLNWTPGESFGANGPYLPDEQLIVPDEQDAPDTEFYHFSEIDLGEFWAGTMVKYVPLPTEITRNKSMIAHREPYTSYEWWISPDGLNWERPFRENSALDEMPGSFAFNLGPPIVIGDELRWAVEGNVYVLNRRRMFYTYCRSNAEITTRELVLSGQPISLEVGFATVMRHQKGLMRQGYLMAELLDEEGNVIPGFERNKCIFKPSERTRLTLKWGNQSLPEGSIGRSVRLRLHFRGVRLYSASY